MAKLDAALLVKKSEGGRRFRHPPPAARECRRGAEVARPRGQDGGVSTGTNIRVGDMKQGQLFILVLEYAVYA